MAVVRRRVFLLCHHLVAQARLPLRQVSKLLLSAVVVAILLAGRIEESSAAAFVAVYPETTREVSFNNINPPIRVSTRDPASSALSAIQALNENAQDGIIPSIETLEKGKEEESTYLEINGNEILFDMHQHEEVEDDGDSVQEDDANNKAFAVSNVKWKKKRYLMMSDVRKSIGTDKAVRKAEEMMRRWWKMYESSGFHVSLKPTTEAYNLWMHAVAKSSSYDKGRKAEDILRHELMPHANPNVVSFATVMDAYARSSTSRSSKNSDPGEAPAHNVERILFDLIRLSEERPDLNLKVTSVTCDIALRAWAQQGTWESAERAEHILLRMEQLLSASTTSSGIRPTEHSYAAVIDAWAKCRGGGEAASRAQAILDRMLAGDGGGAKNVAIIRPDTVVFNALINAWATSRAPQAGSKAVKLLNQMQELHVKKGYDCSPDTVTYNSVLSAWSHSGHFNAAAQAEKVLQEMMTAHRQAPKSAPAPCTASYNNVLNAWSKSQMEGAAKRAEAVLEYMIRSKEPSIAPDIYSFTTVLDALAKSKEADKAVRARALLDQLLEMYSTTGEDTLRPSTVPFNVVLNAAAFSKIGTTDQQQRSALFVAVETFRRMRDCGVQPDDVSYGNFLKAFNNLMPPGSTRTSMAMNVFQKCCEDGKVGELVWNEIRRAVPSDHLARQTRAELKGKCVGIVQVKDLPRSWRRNTKFAWQKTPKRKRERTYGTSRKQNSSTARSGPVRRHRNIAEPSYQSGRDL